MKLWFVWRFHGLEGLKRMIRNHIGWADSLGGPVDGTSSRPSPSRF
nr:hypothetical protein [Ensifer aridi]